MIFLLGFEVLIWYYRYLGYFILFFIVSLSLFILVSFLHTQQSMLHRCCCCKKPSRRSSEEDTETNTTGDLHELCDSDWMLYDVQASLPFFFALFLWVFHITTVSHYMEEVLDFAFARKPLFWISYTVQASWVGSLAYSNSLLRVGGWLSH